MAWENYLKEKVSLQSYKNPYRMYFLQQEASIEMFLKIGIVQNKHPFSNIKLSITINNLTRAEAKGSTFRVIILHQMLITKFRI